MSSNLLGHLDQWALERGDEIAYIFLDSKGQETEQITFKRLMSQSKKIASFLTSRNLEKQRIIISLEPGLEFITTFLGCLYAKSIAVPIPPPRSKRQLARTQPVIEDSRPALIIANQTLSSISSAPAVSISEIQNFLPKNKHPLPQIADKDIAFLQYTSGSTSLPKGVVLTHAHLCNHQNIIQKAFDHDEKTKIVGWLPFYHDMGLIGNILQALYLGVTSILMSPMTFIQRPFLWLNAISTYQATTSGGPNFAYEYCLSKISDNEIQRLDLSSWKLAFNGSERILSSTVRSFSRKFKTCGFKNEAFFPCYGLAEATLFVTGKNALSSTSFSSSQNSVSDVVSCGSTVLNEEVLIVDPNTLKPCVDHKQGEIWVRGQSVAQGYWNKEDESIKTFKAYTVCGKGPCLRTGDLGFIQNKELFVLGREKNLIILRGKNYFPHDLENCVKNSHNFISKNAGVVFSVERKKGENLVVIQEINRSLKDNNIADEIFNCIKESLYATFEISPQTILLVKENSLPRTTSGKLQHYLAKQQFESNLISPVFLWNQGEHYQINHKANIVDALSHFLGIPPISIEKNTPIISLGLDSLTGTQFLSWLESKFNVELDLHFLLNGASIEQLEAVIKEAPQLSPRPKINLQTEFPLSWNQKNVWIFTKLNPSSLAYNIFFNFRLKGQLEILQLKKALEILVDRHSLLRTKFKDSQSEPLQVIEESIEVPLFIKYLENDSVNEIEQKLSQEIENEHNYCFELASAPLFRVVLLQIANKNSLIMFHFHHIICDGWSIKTFIDELEKIYRALCSGSELNLPPLSSSYQEYVAWQKELHASYDYPQVESHWKQKLESAEYPATTLFPFRTGKSSTRSSSKSFHIEKIFFHRLHLFSKEKKMTLSVILMAAFHAILHLYSGEKKVYVGYPKLNRPDSRFQNIVGFFVNTLVCKTELDSTVSFANLLQQVKTSIWESKKESAYPLQDLLDNLHPPRFEHTSPLFQTMFVMQTASTSQTHFAGCEIEKLHTPSREALYDLVLEVREKKNHIELIFEYKFDKISDDFLSEMAKSYFSVLDKALSDASKKISLYELLPIETLLSEFPLKKIPLNPDESIITLFQKQVQNSSEKIAVYSDSGNLTYRQLNNLVNHISNQLLKNKIKVGELVGICLDRNPYLIASLLGILKSGGAYLPIDFNYPNQRIQNIIEDAQPRFIITNEIHQNTFHFFQGILLNPKNTEEESFKAPLVPKNSPAYILYTSGSTGTPKGVVVEHQSLANFAQSAIQLFNLVNTDRPLQFSSINWDTASEEIYPTLLSGASIVLRGEDRIEGFSDLLSRTHKYKITTWNLPSSYWHDLVDKLYREQINIPPSLRLVIVGGERVNRSKVDIWLNQFSAKAQLLNTYGSTETTSISSGYDLANWKKEWQDPPIGPPINNVQLYVLNSELLPVPKGIVGNLYIAGTGLAREYLNKPELTQQKFIFHPQLNERLYDTGDTAYYSLSGELLLGGRKDRQIKRRGYRIELDEIETQLQSIKDIENCILTYDRKIIAYVILLDPSSVNPGKIKSKLREKLPDYLMPDAFIFLTSIPRLPNGKIDYLTLKTKKNEPTEKQETPSNSTNGIEQKVLEIWKSILDLDQIGIDDSFFDTGGNSLLLIQLHENLQKEFSIKFNISLLFSHFSISSQAQKICNLMEKSIAN